MRRPHFITILQNEMENSNLKQYPTNFSQVLLVESEIKDNLRFMETIKRVLYALLFIVVLPLGVWFLLSSYTRNQAKSVIEGLYRKAFQKSNELGSEISRTKDKIDAEKELINSLQNKLDNVKVDEDWHKKV